MSFQAARAEAKDEWKALVRAASRSALPQDYFATTQGLAITVLYFPDRPMQGDLDNIVKLILDALSRHIYEDDSQIERIVVPKFEPARVFAFSAPTHMLEEGMRREKPIVYIRLSNDPFEDLS